MSLFSLCKRFSSLGLAIASTCVANPLLATPLEDIQERGMIQIAVKENVRPLAFRDSAGNLQGLEIDIARRLAEELMGDDAMLELIPVKNQERLDLLLQGEIDLVIAQLGLNASRRRLVDFSDYYYLDGLGFVTKKAELTEAHQITTQRVAVLNSSEAIAAVRAYFPATALVAVNSYEEALANLENNQADLFVGDHSVLTGWTQDYPEYRLLPAWLEGNALAIAMPKGDQHQSLYDEIQTLMAEWQESGWLQDRINHWGLP